ncbi:ATP-dependent RNA helicase DEAH12, chloroplastic [Linum grandiflorum]
MTRPYNDGGFRRSQPPGNLSGHPRPPFRNNYYNQQQQHHQKPYPGASYQFSRPAAPRIRPNFLITLLLDGGGRRNPDTAALIAECAPGSSRIVFSSSGNLAASIYFSEWGQTLSTMTKLWDRRLKGDHCLIPKLESFVMVPSDSEELSRDLAAVFGRYVRGLIGGKVVREVNSKMEGRRREIGEVSRKLGVKRGNRFDVFMELSDRKKFLVSEVELMEKRLEEFKAAMRCVLKYIDGGNLEEEEEGGAVDVVEVEPLLLEGEVDWVKIHKVILREIRRLEDGLPIYAHRREILARIKASQIMVLIGETGSGKSTQLVQFLADSGIGSSGSVICTQPRKIAAMSIADRVKGESRGCYKDDSVVSYPTFSSNQEFGAKIIYATDHCLLQHFMHDRNLSGISCIVIDEAHERSLSTDLLLALIKRLLFDQTRDLRLVIMSATADANQLSAYFFGCNIFHVSGRNFPVDVRYVPCSNEASTSGTIAPYVYEVANMAKKIHKTEKEGTILAFLTSQAEVEWACEKFEASFAIALPLHGKLSHEDQFRIFQEYPGKRKVIFATNLAETSLTIPGVKYVVDSGMVKESRFESGTGMSMLKICRISQSSAQQRAGRAGRTEPGICYRLYSEQDFESMPLNQEPEIRRVHLGIAVLRILALGIKNINEFNFVDAPSSQAIDLAIRNLVQLGSIRQSNGMHELTDEGRYFVKLGIEPRLGKLIITCFRHGLGKEGLALAAVMANASSIFCRVGSLDDKIKADCFKVQFCHQSGDLLTLLSVFKKWEAVHRDSRSKWCWDNSINAKSMRRCYDSVKEIEECLRREVSIIVPTHWVWSPLRSTEHDKHLKLAILSSLVENVAMYSGYDQVGYQVAMTGQSVRLHPSCSLQMFAEKPHWVVFSEVLSTTNDYLVCVTAFDFESLSSLEPPPPYDFNQMESQKLKVKTLTGFGSLLLKRFCGKYKSNLQSFVKCCQTTCSDKRIGIEVSVDQNEIQLFATTENMEKLSGLVEEAVEYEQKVLRNECMERHLYHGIGFSSSVALFGAGAVIKHLELQKRFLTVEIFLSVDMVDDKELLMFVEEFTSGTICSIHKFFNAQRVGDMQKWGKITFLTPIAAEKACQLDGVEFHGSIMKVIPSQTNFGSDHIPFSFPSVSAKVFWPRRYSTGTAIVRCYNTDDATFLAQDLSQLVIGDNYIRSSTRSRYRDDCVVLKGIDKGIYEGDIIDAVKAAAGRQIEDVFLLWGDPLPDPPSATCAEALMREMAPFMSKNNPNISACRVQLFPLAPKDSYRKAEIIFDGRLHLEAARALEHLEGKIFPGGQPWQKIKCQQFFYSSLTCCAAVYFAIEKQLNSLLESFRARNGVTCTAEKLAYGSWRVKLSANATKTVAELRRPLEELMRGRIINNDSLSQTVLQHLFTPQGVNLMREIQQATDTYILFDRRNFNVRIFGSSVNIAAAEKKLIDSLLTYHERRQLQVHMKGGGLPPDLMKRVVEKFGPDLKALKSMFGEAEIALDTRHHVISVHGDKEVKKRVEEVVRKVANDQYSTELVCSDLSCPICLCEVENGFRLEGCSHLFCQTCLMDQFDSAMKNLDSFPVCCAQQGCRTPIYLTDLRSLLSPEKLEELFQASLRSFVASSGGTYRFCPSPDCPSVYQVAPPSETTEEEEEAPEPFSCELCFTETCTRCHLENHPSVSCEKYKEYKEDPDLSLKEWCKGKQHVKTCPVCSYTIEKVDGCNHVECRCGRHVCWVCLEHFGASQECYAHLQSTLHV